MNGTDDAVVVDCTTVTDREPLVYIALQALACSVTVISVAATRWRIVAVPNSSAAPSRQCIALAGIHSSNSSQIKKRGLALLEGSAKRGSKETERSDCSWRWGSCTATLRRVRVLDMFKHTKE